MKIINLGESLHIIYKRDRKKEKKLCTVTSGYQEPKDAKYDFDRD